MNYLYYSNETGDNMNKEEKKGSIDLNKKNNLIETFSLLSNLLDSTSDLILITEVFTWKIIFINDINK